MTARFISHTYSEMFTMHQNKIFWYNFDVLNTRAQRAGHSSLIYGAENSRRWGYDRKVTSLTDPTMHCLQHRWRMSAYSSVPFDQTLWRSTRASTTAGRGFRTSSTRATVAVSTACRHAPSWRARTSRRLSARTSTARPPAPRRRARQTAAAVWTLTATPSTRVLRGLRSVRWRDDRRPTTLKIVPYCRSVAREYQLQKYIIDDEFAIINYIK